eukprot:SAG31_NODE_7519_length_1666_cov_1.835354_1_plen_138_part_00
MAVASALMVAAAAAAGSGRPHIVFLLADDLGFADVGWRNGTDVETPHLAALAAAGLKLNSLYTQLVCSPSRAAVLTGKFPYRLGLSHGFIAAGAPYGLPLTERTMAQELKFHGALPRTQIWDTISPMLSLTVLVPLF